MAQLSTGLLLLHHPWKVQVVKFKESSGRAQLISHLGGWKLQLYGFLKQPELRGVASEARDLCWQPPSQVCPAAWWPLAPSSSIRPSSAQLCQESPLLQIFSFPHMQNRKSLCFDFLSGTRGGSTEIV